MSIVTHQCLGRKAARLGSALDCPECWEALELAADLYEAEQEAARVKAALDQEDPEVFHHTTADTHPDGTGGGWWSVVCTCGWTRSGHYARPSGEPVALRLADLRGAEHAENPDKRCAYCGHPEREARCTFCKDSNTDRRPRTNE